MHYYIAYKPLRGKMHAYAEIMNFSFLLLGSYYMIIFSNWVFDIEMRYTFGNVFVYMTGFFIAMNFIFILLEVYYNVVLMKRRAYFRRKMRQ